MVTDWEGWYQVSPQGTSKVRTGRGESSARGCGKTPENDFAIDRKSLSDPVG